jgi:rare lipoprotein A
MRALTCLRSLIAAWALGSLVLLMACAPMAKHGAASPPAADKPVATKANPPQAPAALPPVVLPTAGPTAPAEPASSEPSVANTAQAAAPLRGPQGWTESGIASWYGPRFQGRRTASGERFDTQELTAAHKTLPFGTRVRVKSLVNGKEVIVRINDRGPFIKGRIIDLSKAAAQAIGLVGVKQVLVERLN